MSVQEKHCKEPKDNPLDALQFEIDFEDGFKRPKTYGNISQETRVKEDAVCAVSGSPSSIRHCWRWPEAISRWIASHYAKDQRHCVVIARKRHLERACDQKRKHYSA